MTNQVGRLTVRSWAAVSLAAVTALAPASSSAQDPPRFTASVEVLSVDVTVLDRSGRPVSDLGADDFSVEVDGAARRVVSAQWVPLAVSDAQPPPPVPAGYSSNEGSATGRLMLIVVDQPNIRFGGLGSVQRALGEFVDSLQPTDRVAAVGLGPGSISTPFTADRERVKRALSRMSGTSEPLRNWQYNITISEAVEIYRTNPMVLNEVARRECSVLSDAEFLTCQLSVQSVAHSIAAPLLTAGRETFDGLESLLKGLSAIDAPKTLILISEGFVVDSDAALRDLGELAQESRTAIYALKMDDQPVDVAVRDLTTTPFQDSRLRASSIESLTAAARGSLLYAAANSAGALRQIEMELGGYYLLGLESHPSDADGRTHRIEVDITREGTTLRWRRELTAGGASRAPDSPLQAAIKALESPLMIPVLPLRVATFSLPDPVESNVQLLLHAAIGSDYASPSEMALAYAITDADGRVIESQAAAGRFSPVMNGVPSPLQFRGSASLPPGEYTLRFAVADGERVGTVEHPLEARLAPAGDVRLSELVVGGPVEARDLLQPSVGHSVYFGLLHGYLEAVGPDSDGLRVRYEVTSRAGGDALLSADVEPVRAGERAIFAHMMAVRRLPDGEYVLRATVLDGDDRDAKPISTLTRSFEVAPPPVLMAPAEGGGGSLAVGASEVFLPVDDSRLSRPFDRRQVSQRDVLQAFRERVTQRATEAFDRGVSQLSSGDYPRAETSFKSAIQIDADSTAPIAYLAATFAAAGRDDQAAGAWQTALIDGGDLPQIYLWLADALIRTRDMVQARSILEEAFAKWPADVRFAKPMALVYATFGLGPEAVRTIERHLDAFPDDLEAMATTVEWIYHLHLAGAVAQSRGDDVRRARQYADAYASSNGPQAALVKEWMSAIER